MTMFADVFPPRSSPASDAGARTPPRDADEGGRRPGSPELYAEEDLAPPEPQPPQSEGALSTVGLLQATADPAARGRLVRSLLQAIGFEWLDHGTLVRAQGRLRPQRFLTSHAPAEWTVRYFARRHDDVDPRWERLAPSGLPVVWDADQLRAWYAAAPVPADVAGRRQRFLDDLAATGMASGVMFRVASATDVHEQTVIGLSSPRSGRAWITDGVAGQALMLGLSLHEHLSHRSRRSPAHPAVAPGASSPMSPTQRDILRQLIEGRSDKEIAHRLQLSLHAVDYHMRQLRRRFQARNRVQLLNAVSGSH